MPKPLKKPPVEPVTTPPHGDPLKEKLSADISELGSGDGKVSGAERMDVPSRQRREIAMKAAKARWTQKKKG